MNRKFELILDTSSWGEMPFGMDEHTAVHGILTRCLVSDLQDHVGEYPLRIDGIHVKIPGNPRVSSTTFNYGEVPELCSTYVRNNE